MVRLQTGKGRKIALKRKRKVSGDRVWTPRHFGYTFPKKVKLTITIPTRTIAFLQQQPPKQKQGFCTHKKGIRNCRKLGTQPTATQTKS